MNVRIPTLVLLLFASCRSPESNVTPTTVVPSPSATPPSPPAPPVAKKGPTKIDEYFQPMVETLPKAATISEQNGASNECKKHGSVTYTLLYAASEKVPLANDADLVDLVPWLRHPDQCMRQIAIDAMVPKIGFDRNRLSLPDMHEVDHYLYHQLLVALIAYLDKKHVARPRQLFEGMYLDVRDADFAPLIDGKWAEEANPHKNFRIFVKLENKTLAVVTHHTHDDPKWPDRTMTSEIKDAKVNDQKQFEVTGLWRQESTAKGYQGQKIQPSDTTYRFWPISRDLVWFDEGRENNWVKLLREKK